MTNTNPGDKKSAESYGSAEIKILPKSQMEITVSVPTEIWEKFRKEALKNINDSVSLDGFRKGLVPENILIAKVGEAALLQEMSELSISKAYLDILMDKKIEAIGKPKITLTKLAAGNPLEFKIVTAVIPSFELPDCQALAKKEIAKSDPKEMEVEDKDVEEAILKIRKSKVSHDSHDHEKMSPEEHEKAILDSLPEFNDDFVRSLGDFKDIEDFKKKVRDIVGQNKKDEAREKLRIRIAESLVAASKIDLPDIMVESELNRTQSQFEIDLEKMGVKMDDYVKHAKKTLEEIRADWRPHAEKKAKIQIILNKISVAKNIKPTPAEIEAEAKHILDHYKDADKERAYTYAESVLTNEKVFQWLEQSEK